MRIDLRVKKYADDIYLLQQKILFFYWVTIHADTKEVIEEIIRRIDLNAI